MDSDRVVAQLIHRLQPIDAEENNLVWSIIARLKGKEYLSDYQPRTDPPIAAHLLRLRDEAG